MQHKTEVVTDSPTYLLKFNLYTSSLTAVAFLYGTFLSTTSTYTFTHRLNVKVKFTIVVSLDKCVQYI